MIYDAVKESGRLSDISLSTLRETAECKKLALKEKIRIYQQELYEIEQILGKALGYPYIDHTVCSKCDEHKGCTCGNPTVCIGEHTTRTLAEEAARAIKYLESLESLVDL